MRGWKRDDDSPYETRPLPVPGGEVDWTPFDEDRTLRHSGDHDVSPLPEDMVLPDAPDDPDDPFHEVERELSTIFVTGPAVRRGRGPLPARLARRRAARDRRGGRARPPTVPLREPSASPPRPRTRPSSSGPGPGVRPRPWSRAPDARPTHRHQAQTEARAQAQTERAASRSADEVATRRAEARDLLTAARLEHAAAVRAHQVALELLSELNSHLELLLAQAGDQVIDADQVTLDLTDPRAGIAQVIDLRAPELQAALRRTGDT